MISNITNDMVKLCAHFECGGDPNNPKWLRAYLDSGGVWTIGIGTIQYPNGQRVKKGDVITAQQRDEYFVHEVRNKVDRVNVLTRDDINQNQFNAVVDLSYNIGTGKRGLQGSTLLKVLNNKLTDPVLVNRFLDWRYDNGKMIPGLLRRRMSDALLYFTGVLKYDWKEYKKFSPATIAEVKKEISKFAS